MRRVQLFYKDMSEIVGSNGFAVVRLVDLEEQRAVCVICDKSMVEQLMIRFNRMPGRQFMLPEVRLQMIQRGGFCDMELTVNDIIDGQYQVSLLNKATATMVPIRMSDAILLHYISKIPIYIDADLMLRQSTPYQSETRGISIPINTLDTENLKRQLERAIETEDYHLASFLHEELQKRNVQ